MSNIHILTLNVQGIRDKNKRYRLYEWLKCQKFNICFLQETHLTEDIINTFRNETQNKYISYHSFGKSNSCGVSILINESSDFSCISCETDKAGRMLVLTADVYDDKYTFVNIYAPNDHTNRNIYFKNISLSLNKLKINKDDTVIIGGDFNEVQSTNDRKTKVKPRSN